MPYSHEPRTSWVFFVSSANWTPIWARKNCCGAHLVPLRSCCERPSISFWRRAKLRHHSCAEKQIHGDSGKATAIPRLPSVGCWQIGRFGCFFISKELNFFLGVLTGVAWSSTSKIWRLDSCPPNQIPILGEEKYSPQNRAVKSLEMFFLGSTGKIASVQSPPETFAKKPIWLQCNRHTSRGLWKQPGPRMRVHNHLPIFLEKYRHHLSQKLSERLVPNLSNFSPSLFKYALTLAHFWQREWFLPQVLRFLAANLIGYSFAGNNTNVEQRCGGKESPTRWWMIHIWWHFRWFFLVLIYIYIHYIYIYICIYIFLDACKSVCAAKFGGSPKGFLTGFSLARLKLRVPAQVSRSASAISIRADRLDFFWVDSEGDISQIPHINYGICWDSWLIHNIYPISINMLSWSSTAMVFSKWFDWVHPSKDFYVVLGQIPPRFSHTVGVCWNYSTRIAKSHHDISCYFELTMWRKTTTFVRSFFLGISIRLHGRHVELSGLSWRTWRGEDMW